MIGQDKNVINSGYILLPPSNHLGECGDGTLWLSALNFNYLPRILFLRLSSSSGPLHLLFRKHRARSNPRMAQPGSTHDAQSPGEQTHQLSFFFFINNFIFLVVSCALKPIPMKLSNTHLHKRLQMWEIQIRIWKWIRLMNALFG